MSGYRTQSTPPKPDRTSTNINRYVTQEDWMDIVNPLPKSRRGSLILDHATRYPEAVPLLLAACTAVAREVFLLLYRAEVADEI